MDKPTTTYDEPHVFPFDTVKRAKLAHHPTKPRKRDYVYLVIFVLMMWVGIFWWILPYGTAMGLRSIYVFVLFSVFYLSAIGYLFFWRPRQEKKKRASFESDLPDDSARLWLVGDPDRVFACGEFADVPFEPRIFRAYLSLDDTGRISRYALDLMVISLLAMLIIPPLVFHVGFFDYCAWKFWAVTAAVALLVDCIWPSYFRVVPGRLDIIRFSNFSNRVILLESVNLRGARVIADFDSSRIRIRPANDEERHESLKVNYVPGKARLVHAVFWAALSTHESPPLPNDRLLG